MDTTLYLASRSMELFGYALITMCLLELGAWALIQLLDKDEETTP